MRTNGGQIEDTAAVAKTRDLPKTELLDKAPAAQEEDHNGVEYTGEEPKAIKNYVMSASK